MTVSAVRSRLMLRLNPSQSAPALAPARTASARGRARLFLGWLVNFLAGRFDGEAPGGEGFVGPALRAPSKLSERFRWQDFRRRRAGPSLPSSRAFRSIVQTQR